MSDIIFMKSIKDKNISHTELDFMKIGSIMVWVGLVLLYISGALIFSTNPSAYLSSHKFLSKFTIVVLLTINGYFFHKVHMQKLKKHKDQDFAELKHLSQSRRLILISGVISVVSWTFALVLGGWKNMPFNYFEILGTYFFVVLVGVLFANILFKKKLAL